MNRWHRVRTTATRSLALWAALALLTGALLATACGGGDSGDDSNGDGAAATAAASGGSSDDLQEIESTILLKDNLFESATLTFPVGSKVTFKYDNVGLAVHNMIVQSQDVEGQNYQSPVAVNPGEKGEFEATFTKAGTFKFICVYHQPGMEGTITIE